MEYLDDLHGPRYGAAFLVGCTGEVINTSESRQRPSNGLQDTTSVTGLF